MSGASECLDTQALVNFIEDRADDEDRARIEEHASLCASCRELLSSFARSGTPVRRPPVVAPHADRVLAPSTRVGRYVITHQVGAGGMGIVYAAHDPALDRMVAVKVLRGDGDRRLQERLRREAIAMARLAHPNVIAVYDVGEFEDRTFIAMEYVAGETLARWSAAPRSPREILEVYRAAGSGLAAAHAAGIVHRDFKPENVLIGTDGRARIGDFGLARTIRATSSPHDAALSPATPAMPPPCDGPRDGSIDQRLTTSGMLGTPYYLAPEVYAGADADARSDQFSFCMALSTALHGRRPPIGDPLDPASQPERPDQRRAPHVPRRIRTALERGLSLDPLRRFASLGDLLAALAPRSHRWTVGFGAALTLVAWSVARSPSEIPDQRCTGAEAAFAATWSAGRRSAIDTAFAASHLPYAADAFQRVAGALDRYAARWTAAHSDTCRATRIRGEQTEVMLELRMTCLEHRRQEADALVGTLATADAATVSHAVTAVLALGDLAVCADIAALSQVVRPPADPSTRTRIAALAARLADARAKHQTGAFARARELIRPIVDEARIVAYRPFEAEVELLQGTIERDLGDIAHAEASVQAAVWAAEAGRHDEIAARAWALLVYIVGCDRMDLERAKSLVPRATAAIARLGGNTRIEAALERALGSIDYRHDQFDSAIAHNERALALAERAFGPQDLDVAKAVDLLGLALKAHGQFDRAVPLLQRAVGIYEHVLGSEHPVVARGLLNLGSAHMAMWDYRTAEVELRRALAIRETALGPDHREVAESLWGLGHALRYQGKLEQALAADRRSLALGERIAGRDDVLLMGPLYELGCVEVKLGALPDADEHLDRALVIVTKLLGPRDFQTMSVIVARGDALMARSRWRAAAALFAQAIPILEAAPGGRDELALAVAQLARAHVEQHQPALALAPLERLASTMDEQPPDLRPTIELTLARALWDSGGDRARAYRLATHALASSAQIPATSRDDVRQIERWLASHRVR